MTKAFILFIVIGLINTFNGTALAYSYSFIFQVNLAFALGFITANIISYFLNAFIVFHGKPGLVGYMKFAVANLPNFVIQNILVLILYTFFHWHIALVYALAIVIGVPVTFLFVKLYAFKKIEG